MVLEVDVNPESVKKLEKFYGTGKYKDLAVNTQSFSRKLNEERKMRIPYVDGQVIFHVNINIQTDRCYQLYSDRCGPETLQQQPESQ